MKQPSKVFLLLVSGAVAVGTFSLPSIAKANTLTIKQEHIWVNNSLYSQPDGFVYSGTTYMPLWYVMQALQETGVVNTWDGQQWNIQSSTQSVPVLNSSTNAQSITINGRQFAGFQSIVRKDPSSGKDTTYMPVWYIMQALTALGIENTWDGQTWSMTHALAEHYGVYKKTTLQNNATDDSSYWQRMNENYYLAARTNPMNEQTGNAETSITVGQKIYLEAYSTTANVYTSQTSWMVNSSDAKITQSGSGWTLTWPGGNPLQIGVATFVASKPGVYTVQAKVGNYYTVPLVITVGLAQLRSTPVPLPNGQSGIKPLPSSVQLAGTASDSRGGQYYIGQPQGNWVPVYGTVSGTNTVAVIFQTNTKHVWSYSIPVTNGKFSGMVFCPQTGAITVSFDPHLMQDITNVNLGKQTPLLAAEDLTIVGTPAKQSQIDLLSSSKMDYNMSNAFNEVAATLMENSPSVDTGIEAINNYVANLVRYNTSELQTGNYQFQDSYGVLQSHEGVCEDYAELEASLLRSIGVPVETIGGTANDASLVTTPEGHEWLKAWNGSKWVTADPTWSIYVWSGGAEFLSNQYFTQTSSLSKSHVINASLVGTDDLQ